MKQYINFLQAEAGLVFGGLSTVLFVVFGKPWLSHLENPWWSGFLFLWLFLSILWLSFVVVRHADALAVRLGEPYGTLLLTLSVIGIEVAMIAAVCLSGKAHPGLARDTMYSVVMIVLTGMLGGTLLAGGLRHHRQEYNLSGANAYLSVLVPLAVLALVVPRFTHSAPGGSPSFLQATFLLVTSAALYVTFLFVQTGRHASLFLSSSNHGEHKTISSYNTSIHAVLLLAAMFPIVLLAKKLGVLVDHVVHTLKAPPELGGFLVAILVLSPEGLSAFRAARENRLQRTMNILLGSATSTIGMTVPVILAISLFSGHVLELGLETRDIVMLMLTLFTSVITLATGRTTLLQGAVHLILFAAYIMLIFDKVR
ncbi:MAG: sodium-potassium/proton antiporter ChaA [Pirellulales bacterium]